MLRPETRARARALQMLYAWELQGRPPMAVVAGDLPGRVAGTEALRVRAEGLAGAVAAAAARLDGDIEALSDNWRPERIGAVERNILRLAAFELERGEAPPRVVIDEALRLAHWFAGPRAPAFVNGVLDALAHRLGCL